MFNLNSINIRRLIIRGLEGGGRGHIGSSMSLVEILISTFCIFNFLGKKKSLNDKLILSKGHGCLTLYAILCELGHLKRKELDSYCKFDSKLGGHTSHFVNGIEASTGALGHGLAIGVGKAAALKIKKLKNKVIVVVGDGELNEGSIWESALSANKNNLKNLIVLIDYNKIQSYGFTKDVCDLEPLSEKWRAFGFNCFEIDGHNSQKLNKLLNRLKSKQNLPTAIICNTIKGKGIKFAENDPNWHHKSKLSKDDINQMKKCLNA